MSSPISLALGGAPLPGVFDLQFCHSAERPYAVQLQGQLEEVWFRPAWIYPLLWLLEKAGILISEAGRGIPTTLTVTAAVDGNGQPFQIWKRRFHGKQLRKFDVKVVYDPASKRVVDLVGRGALLALAWEIVCAGDELQIDVVKAGFRNPWGYLWMPDWLWPLLLGRETFRQRICEGQANAVSIDLLITHPFLGKVFGYRGTFAVEKVGPDAQAALA